MELVDTLHIKTSADVVLLNMVDSLARWSVFVMSHISNYIRERFLFSAVDEEAIALYRELRVEFGWTAQAPLFQWALDGYPQGEYSKLRPAVEQLSKLRDRDGISLFNVCRGVIPDLMAVKESTLSELRSLQLENVLERISRLYPSRHTARTVDCYLLYSPDERWTCGGADGGAISVEVLLNERRKLPLSMIAHELCHLLFQVHEHYIDLDEKPVIGPHSRSGFFEEAIVQSISPVVLFGVSQQSEYNKIEKPEGWNRSLLDVVESVSPSIRSYLEEDGDPEVVRASIDDTIHYFDSLL